MYAEQVLSLEPASQTVRPGRAAGYTLTIANPTTLDVTYDLSVAGVPQSWVDMRVAGGSSGGQARWTCR